MEILTFLVSGLISLISPVGVVVDRVAENTLRSRLAKVEQLQVRVDNAPSYQLVNGRVDRVRIAGRGVFPIPELRLAVLEVDTDAIAVKPASLRKGKPQFEQPLRAGVRLVLTQEDLNRALQSPAVTERLRNLGIGLLRRREAQQVARYTFLNPQIEFLDNQRLRLRIDLQEQGYTDLLSLKVETGVEVVAGRTLRLIDLQASANGEPVPPQILQAIAQGVSQRLDLRRLEASGVTARILNFRLERQGLELATFVQVK